LPKKMTEESVEVIPVLDSPPLLAPSQMVSIRVGPIGRPTRTLTPRSRGHPRLDLKFGHYHHHYRAVP
jgi:hypothetical protein